MTHGAVKLKPGEIFGRLTLVEYLKGSRWLCRCACGARCTVRAGNLTTGNTQSCGCLNKELISQRMSNLNEKRYRPAPGKEEQTFDLQNIWHKVAKKE